MAHKCPRCGSPIVRSAPVGCVFMGPVGVLFGGGLCPVFRCKSCGQIPRAEFPAETRSRMLMTSLGLVAIGVGIIALAIVLLAWYAGS